ncbi:MAG: hypothetical protein HQ541_10075, partial [Mariniphaga sp.]|nr:hypothetical protein [Mariniphaga sp.]
MADIDLKKILFTDDIDFIQDCMSDSKVIEFVRSKFKRMSRNLAIGFIPKLLGIYTIKISLFNNIENTTTFLQYNKKRFDENNILKEEFYTTIKRELKTFLAEIGKEIPNKNEDSS